jgi:hypothetical protein
MIYVFVVFVMGILAGCGMDVESTSVAANDMDLRSSSSQNLQNNGEQVLDYFFSSNYYKDQAGKVKVENESLYVYLNAAQIKDYGNVRVSISLKKYGLKRYKDYELVELLNRIDTSRTGVLRPIFYNTKFNENAHILQLQMIYHNLFRDNSTSTEIHLGAHWFKIGGTITLFPHYKWLGSGVDLTQFFNDSQLENVDSLVLEGENYLSGIRFKTQYFNIVNSSQSLSKNQWWNQIELQGKSNVLDIKDSQFLQWDGGKVQGWKIHFAQSKGVFKNISWDSNLFAGALDTLILADNSDLNLRQIDVLGDKSSSLFLWAQNQSSVYIHSSEIQKSLVLENSEIEVRNSTLWQKILGKNSVFKCYNSNDSMGVLNEVCSH